MFNNAVLISSNLQLAEITINGRDQLRELCAYIFRQHERLNKNRVIQKHSNT
jgi:hypothetical protein